MTVFVRFSPPFAVLPETLREHIAATGADEAVVAAVCALPDDELSALIDAHVDDVANEVRRFVRDAALGDALERVGAVTGEDGVLRLS